MKSQQNSCVCFDWPERLFWFYFKILDLKMLISKTSTCITLNFLAREN